MNRDFDFDDIGKRMPYKTPESFFEDNRRRILKHTCGEERRVKNRLHIIIPTVPLRYWPDCYSCHWNRGGVRYLLHHRLLC